MFAVAALAIVGLHVAEPSLVPGLDLDWRAPPGCPDAAAIAGMVNSLLHHPSAPGPDPPRVRAVVSRVASGRWELRLDLYARRGHSRRIARWDDCRVLARAAALLIAIHRDPLAAAIGLDAPAPPPSTSADDVPPPPEPAPSDVVVPPAPAIDLAPETSAPPPAAPAAAPEIAADPLAELSREADRVESPPRRVGVAGHVRLDGGLDVGVLPGLGGHAGLFGGLSLRRVRVEVGLVGAPLRIAPGDPGGRFDRLVAAARVCPIWTRASVTLALCLGAEAGAIHGVARAVERPNPRWAPWVGLSLSPALRWRVAGPLGLYVAVDGVLALARPRFSVNPGRDPVFSAGRAGVRATLGIELQFARRNR